MTRGCLVRSKEVNPKTKGKEYLDELLSNKLGGEFVKLRTEDIKPLLAISFVKKAAEDYELTEAQVKEFILQTNIASGNYLIREILSDPSGQIPQGLVNEEALAPKPSITTPTEASDLFDDSGLDSLLNRIIKG